MGIPGQPCKLTPELTKTICKYIQNGNTFRRSCLLSNISEAAFMKWKQKGNKEKSGKYVQFLQSVKKAEEKFKATNVAIILKAGKDGTWQASAWLLERKYPDEFGRRDRFSIEMDTKLEKFVEAFDKI